MRVMGGIYEIRCGNRRYVDSTTNFENRWKQHRTHLRGGRHTNHVLQNIWNKHGEGALTFVIVELCENANLLFCEQRRIDEIWGTSECMNLCHTAGVAGKRGVPVPSEVRSKIAAKILGTKVGPPSQETRAKIGAAHRGMKRSDETRARQREAAKGRKMPPKTPEHQEKIKESMRAAWKRRKARGESWGGNQYVNRRAAPASRQVS